MSSPQVTPPRAAPRGHPWARRAAPMVALAALSGLLAPGHAAAVDPAPPGALGWVGVPSVGDLGLDRGRAERAG
ncbi:MAG: hypothetical protein JJT89_15105, partial [Nitriliruptoraceae bacterium]|nr:hypothetical protein [Nitriliruptoraceae bacterium]